MTDLIERLRAIATAQESRIAPMYRIAWEAGDALEAKERQLELCRGALADIATGKDMTLALARAKAGRIYEQTKEKP